MENRIRNIILYAQATQDEKIKMIADLFDETIIQTMHFVRVNRSRLSSYENKDVIKAVKARHYSV